MLWVWLAGCSGNMDSGVSVVLEEAPDHGDWSMSGPGGPATTFSESELFAPCAYLNGNEKSVEHHNLVVMHDGWLLFPWAPEDGGGGISFFDFQDPCNPVKIGEVWADGMRERHGRASSETAGEDRLAGQVGRTSGQEVVFPCGPVLIHDTLQSELLR